MEKSDRSAINWMPDWQQICECGHKRGCHLGWGGGCFGDVNIDVSGVVCKCRMFSESFAGIVKLAANDG